MHFGGGKRWRPKLAMVLALAALLVTAACTGGGGDKQGAVETGVKATGKIHEVHLHIRPVEGRPIPEFFFEPTGLLVQPGDTVRFIADTPHHTVTAYHPQHGKQQRVPDGVEPFSSPVLPVGTNWEYKFDVKGVYDVWCAPHEQYGMAMRLVVGEAGGPGAEPPSDFGPEGTFGAAGQVLGDAALDPANIIAKGQVAWADISAAAKALPEGGH